MLMGVQMRNAFSFPLSILGGNGCSTGMFLGVNCGSG